MKRPRCEVPKCRRVGRASVGGVRFCRTCLRRAQLARLMDRAATGRTVYEYTRDELLHLAS